jgi:hypothetical protein
MQALGTIGTGRKSADDSLVSAEKLDGAAFREKTFLPHVAPLHDAAE